MRSALHPELCLDGILAWSTFDAADHEIAKALLASPPFCARHQRTQTPLTESAVAGLELRLMGSASRAHRWRDADPGDCSRWLSKRTEERTSHALSVAEARLLGDLFDRFASPPPTSGAPLRSADSRRLSPSRIPASATTNAPVQIEATLRNRATARRKNARMRGLVGSMAIPPATRSVSKTPDNGWVSTTMPIGLRTRPPSSEMTLTS
jgi:hypothetical protein